MELIGQHEQVASVGDVGGANVDLDVWWSEWNPMNNVLKESIQDGEIILEAAEAHVGPVCGEATDHILLITFDPGLILHLGAMRVGFGTCFGCVNVPFSNFVYEFIMVEARYQEGLLQAIWFCGFIIQNYKIVDDQIARLHLFVNLEKVLLVGNVLKRQFIVIFVATYAYESINWVFQDEPHHLLVKVVEEPVNLLIVFNNH